ncbi:MAG: DUF4157 domain-containing protein, partial [Nostoc sp.]|uniref:eCIS core domain-containing protein n=1 Tax=Nostoc sp. TaxID=1180 RepID=UPI002FF7C104
GAEAFTSGNDIFYGKGNSPDNDHLTAHELAHKFQQTGEVQSKGNLQKMPLIQLTKSRPKKYDPSLGVSVKDIQEKLNIAGADPHLEVNGIFGQRTREAVINFQHSRYDTESRPLVEFSYRHTLGLGHNDGEGVVGKLTWAALDKISKQQAVPLTDDEFILSLDTKYRDHSVLNLRRDVKEVVESAMRGTGKINFDPLSIQRKPILLDRKKEEAVILKWDSSWGLKPTSKNISNSWIAIIATKLRVKWAHGLAGWAKLDSSEQSILQAILGGQINKLSNAFVQHIDDYELFTEEIDNADPTKQAELLRGFMADKNSKPFKADEPINTAKVEYSISEPIKKDYYIFKGWTGDGELYFVEFKDGIKFKIIAPRVIYPGYHNHTIQETADAASYVPKETRSLIKVIILNPVVDPDNAYSAVKYSIPNFQSYMEAGSDWLRTGMINIFPREKTHLLESENHMRVTMIHETAHLWSQKNWGLDTSKGKWLEWKNMMNADKVSVSGYAMASIEEDVSETIAIYDSTKGSPRFEEYRQIVPNRFAMLDKEYK